MVDFWCVMVRVSHTFRNPHTLLKNIENRFSLPKLTNGDLAGDFVTTLNRMSDYSDIVAQIEKRNAQRQEEWRAKALARRKQGGKVARGSELSFGVEMDDDDIDELPAHRRRRLRNQHLIPGTLPTKKNVSLCFRFYGRVQLL